MSFQLGGMRRAAATFVLVMAASFIPGTSALARGHGGGHHGGFRGGYHSHYGHGGGYRHGGWGYHGVYRHPQYRGWGWNRYAPHRRPGYVNPYYWNRYNRGYYAPFY